MQSQTYTYQGISGLKAISEHFGVPKGTLSTRITQMGMSLEEAIHAGDSVKSRRKCKHEYNGIQGLKNIAASVGICHQTLNHRMMKGMTLEEAIAAGKKMPYPRQRKESGARKRKPQQRKQTQTQGVRTPDLLDAHWKLALGMRDWS